MAQSGHSATAVSSPLSGVKRTLTTCGSIDLNYEYTPSFCARRSYARKKGGESALRRAPSPFFQITTTTIFWSAL
jgi:hypothetical protein